MAGAPSLAGARTTNKSDPAYGLRQILDLASKALSPAINDVHTAVEAVDHLTSMLVEAARCGGAAPETDGTVSWQVCLAASSGLGMS